LLLHPGLPASGSQGEREGGQGSKPLREASLLQQGCVLCVQASMPESVAFFCKSILIWLESLMTMTDVVLTLM
jgi:hypothetical protein